jgi:uncharacterized SAM-binding protein YcdF (DUF218 family)
MEKLTNREKFISIVDNDICKVSDAIILLEGDGYFRNDKAIELYSLKFAPLIVFTGGIDNPEYGSYYQEDIIERLAGSVKKEDIILERESMNTRQQAEEIMKMATERKWKRIILVASHYHQYRAYLTFLKRMKEIDLKIEIINAPAKLKWFDETGWGNRFELIDSEFERIKKYKDHCSSFEEAIEYQKWKEIQN